MIPRKPSRRHACIRCVHSKVKCLPLENGMACERCTRLGRDCVFPNASRSSRPKYDSKDRIDRLQEQVDTLATKLAQKDNESARTGLQSPNCDQSGHHMLGTLLKELIIIPGSHNDLFTRGVLTIPDADRLLEKFRTHKMPRFPFIVIPHEMSVSILREQYPFLLLAIMTACLEDNLPLQSKLESEVKTAISTRVIMNNERNMDLLLGLLVHVVWYHYHWQTMHTQMYLLLQMAVMIVVDLGLDKDENFGLYIGVKKPCKSSREGQCQSPTGKRALLACYYLCSVLSIFRKQLFMRHTKWIDECCDTLLEKPEYPTDVLLKSYIDIQSLSRESEEILYPSDHDWAHSKTGPNRDRLLELLHERGKQIQVMASQNNLKTHYTLLFDLKAIPAYTLGHVLRHHDGTFDTNYMNQLWSLLPCTHSCIVSFLELPLDAIIHFPASSFSTLWYCLLILSKLTLSVSTNVWNDKAGFEKKSVCRLGLDITDKFGALSTGDDVWANSRRVVGSMVSWLEKHELSSAQPSNTAPHPVTLNSYGPSHTIHTSDGVYSTKATEPASWHGKSTGFQIGTNVNTVPSSELSSLHSNQVRYAEENLTEEFWDDAIWQQMIDDFAVMPTVLPAHFGFPSPGSFGY